MGDYLIAKGVKTHNLKNIDVKIPKNKLVIMTGVSGSGKTSLAFDTIYKEGQGRYINSLSSYVRQFLGDFDKPDVESIEGLSPAISIDQKTTNKNPRSTVGTITEIYDYFRLLYARIGVPYCPNHHIPINSQTIEEMADRVLSFPDARVQILSPIVRGKKGTHEKVFERLIKDGYSKVRVDSEIYDLEDNIELDKNKKHDIAVVVDRIIIKNDVSARLSESLEIASKLSDGLVIALINDKEFLFSEKYACPECGFQVGKLEPRLFSFNSPFGACPECSGLGFKRKIDVSLLIKDPSLSIDEGALSCWSKEETSSFQILDACLTEHNIPRDIPFMDLTEEQQNIILYGSDVPLVVEYQSKSSESYHRQTKKFEGIINNFERRYMETNSKFIREWIESYMIDLPCEKCHGKRLNEAALSVQVDSMNINELSHHSVKHSLENFKNMSLTSKQKQIAQPIFKEIINRLDFLKNVGLDYLTLDRMAGNLSGGESQRIRLATQIGSKLTGILYVLDEPSIGLHQRDNARLINTLKEMRDLGNTLIVVEHDDEIMRESDYIVDIGPEAGSHGGEVIFSGTYEEILRDENSITGKYLSGRLKIDLPEKRRKPEHGFIEIIGARENNLKNINVKIPFGLLTLVTGVSGSGKSTLVNEILAKEIGKRLYRKKDQPGDFDEIKNIGDIDKLIVVDQSPIGRTPRSNPGTYTGVFDDIRDLFTLTQEAKMRGYDKGRFSFNVKGGRCESCMGDGVIRIEMNFLPDVYITCESCQGKRYNKETLEVRYKGKNISDVLDMTIEDACKFFENIPKIYSKLNTLVEVGLGYIKLGQPAPTLSGGEAQRVKLASELYKRISPKALYILDEPTTGLHTDDVKKLLYVIHKIVDAGASVVIIEHNLDVIKNADYIIDLGPEGGDDGGQVVVTGTPEEVAACEKSYTGQFLKKVL